MDDWFSDQDMDSNSSFFNECHKTNCFVNSEEHCREMNKCGCVATQTHSDYSSLKLSEHLSSKTGNLTLEPTASQGTKRTRISSETRDHILSERKRRQQMAERFIALSAIIPGLKKKNKASVLSEAINYVKELEGRIAVLEQESEKKSSNKSMILIKKCQSHPHSASNYYSHLGSNSKSNHVLPEIQAIGLELKRELLIRILCENRKAILLKLVTFLESLHLSIISSSTLPLGKNTLNITLIAQMGEEYNMTGDELVRKLTQDLFKCLPL